MLAGSSGGAPAADSDGAPDEEQRGEFARPRIVGQQGQLQLVRRDRDGTGYGTFSMGIRRDTRAL